MVQAGMRLGPLAMCCGLLALLGSVGAPEAPKEVVSEVGDLGRSGEAFYLRVDGRMPKQAGLVPARSREAVVRLEAMTRGRDWPGRWKLIEIELTAAVAEEVEMGPSGAPRRVTLSAGERNWLRMPITDRPADLLLRAAGGGFGGSVQLGRVRLVDDTWVIWDTGWSVRRSGGRLLVKSRTGHENAVEGAMPGVLRVREANAIRVVTEPFGTFYANGRNPWTLGEGRTEVVISDDFGRIERNSDGDTDGDGFNDARGATILRVSGRRVVFTVSNGGGGGAAVFELVGLPAGDVTVLSEGRLVERFERLSDGRLLLELPGAAAGEARVEVTVK
jgi:hypothetical protein